jgi:hypothetical protein
VTKFSNTHGLVRNAMTSMQTMEVDYINNDYHNKNKSILLGLHES